LLNYTNPLPLLADPVINDIDVAEKILDEYLSVHAD